jgi:hypothetical protein
MAKIPRDLLNFVGAHSFHGTTTTRDFLTGLKSFQIHPFFFLNREHDQNESAEVK